MAPTDQHCFDVYKYCIYIYSSNPSGQVSQLSLTIKQISFFLTLIFTSSKVPMITFIKFLKVLFYYSTIIILLFINRYDYIDLLANSTFCLVPRGRRLGSFRFLEVLKNGCIPVLLSNDWDLPFKEVLDWSKFSINIDEKLLLQLPSLVREIPDQVILSMKQQALFVWQSYFSSVKVTIQTMLEVCMRYLLLLQFFIFDYLSCLHISLIISPNQDDQMINKGSFAHRHFSKFKDFPLYDLICLKVVRKKYEKLHCFCRFSEKGLFQISNGHMLCGIIRQELCISMQIFPLQFHVYRSMGQQSILDHTVVLRLLSWLWHLLFIHLIRCLSWYSQSTCRNMLTKYVTAYVIINNLFSLTASLFCKISRESFYFSQFFVFNGWFWGDYYLYHVTLRISYTLILFVVRFWWCGLLLLVFPTQENGRKPELPWELWILQPKQWMHVTSTWIWYKQMRCFLLTKMLVLIQLR